MPLQESEAVILRSFPLGEADRLVSFLGRATGRLRGVARGARRPRSRFGSTLEPLSHIRIWFFERETRELVRINQCELIESFLETQRDYGPGLALALVSEITEAVLPEREPSDAAFRLVLVTARAIQQGVTIPLAISYFALWTLRLGGWLPQLDRCARCGRELTQQVSYGSALHAGLACGNCRTPGMRKLSAEALHLSRRMLTERLEQLTGPPDSPAPLEDLNDYLLDLIEHHIERKLASRRLLQAARKQGIES